MTDFVTRGKAALPTLRSRHYSPRGERATAEYRGHTFVISNTEVAVIKDGRLVGFSTSLSGARRLVRHARRQERTSD